MVRVNGFGGGSVGPAHEAGNRQMAAEAAQATEPSVTWYHAYEHDSFTPTARLRHTTALPAIARNENTEALLKELDEIFPDWKLIDALLARDFDKERIAARVNAKDKDKITLLNRACYDPTENGIYVLAKAGADVDAKDAHGSAALHRAAVYGKKQIILALAKVGADVNIRGKHENTPLHQAAYNGKAEAVAALCETGALVNAENRYGSTPLHQAVLNGKPEAILALAKAGADLKAKRDGQTARELAKTPGVLEALEKAEQLQTLRRLGILRPEERSHLHRLPAEIRAMSADFVEGREGASALLTAAQIGDTALVLGLISGSMSDIQKLPSEHRVAALERLARETKQAVPSLEVIEQFAACIEGSTPDDLAVAFKVLLQLR